MEERTAGVRSHLGIRVDVTSREADSACRLETFPDRARSLPTSPTSALYIPNESPSRPREACQVKKPHRSGHPPPDHTALTAHAAPPVDYYASLDIPSTANAQQIRDAYKKAALRHHPDRVPSDSPERPARTKKFQQINDAYYTLSDAQRRREYDLSRNAFHGFASSEAPNAGAEGEVPRPSGAGAMPGGFPWGFFGGRAQDEAQANEFSNEQFSGVFEEMMRDEGLASETDNTPTQKFWSIVGAASGGAMGFIVANFPGAVAGAVAGNRLGAIRDKRGKSVYSVFQELDQGERMRILGELAQRVLSSAISG